MEQTIVKQAVLIVAHNNFQHLKNLMLTMYDGNVSFFIHLDKGSGFSVQEIEELKKLPGVRLVATRYKTFWASHNFVMAALFLAEEVCKYKDIEYVHLISGQDYPVQSMSSFHQYLSAFKGKEFITYATPPNKTELERIRYYKVYEWVDGRSAKGAKLIDWMSKVQRKLGITRKLPFEAGKLFLGSNWWTLSLPCLQYIVNYTATEPHLLRKLRFTFVPDEYYFQTVIMNSPFREQVMNDNLRYIIWESRNGNLPANLDESDLEPIKNGNYLFARKIVYPVSKTLVERLNSRIANQKLNPAVSSEFNTLIASPDNNSKNGEQ
jgi:hypothetical protein